MEQALITKILETKEISKAINSKVSNCIRVYRDIWEWIEKYYLKYKAIPTFEIVQKKFPEFEPYRDESTLDYLIDEVTNDYLRFKLEDLLTKSSEALEESPREALNYIFAKTAALGHQTDVVKDVNLAEDYWMRVNSLRHRAEISEGGTQILGIPTGIDPIDYLFGGWQSGDFTTLMGWTSSGKEVSTNTIVITPSGKKRIGDLVIGEDVIGRDGLPTQVIGIYPQTDRSAYRLTLSDKTSVICGAEHLWTVETAKQRQRRLSGKKESLRTATTKELIDEGIRFKNREGRRSGYKFYLPFILPSQFDKIDLPLDSYTLGMLLSNGHLGHNVAIASNKPFIHKKIRDNNPELNIRYEDKHGSMTASRSCFHAEIFSVLSNIGLRYKKSSEKFIPPIYLTAHEEARWELLRGLMDGDGQPNPGFRASYSSFSLRLANDIANLVRSLGGVAKVSEWDDKCGFRVSIWTPQNPFSLPEKAEKYSPPNEWFRAIESIERVPEEDCEMICIKVAAKDELFLIDEYIPTHNTWLATYFAVQAWKMGKVPLYFSLEMDDVQFGYRVDTLMAEGHLSNTSLINARNISIDSYEQWAKDRYTDKHPFYIVTNEGLDEINQFTVQTKIEQYKPDLVVLDYHSLFDDGRSGKTETEKHRNLSKDFKRMAVRFGVPIIDIVAVTMDSDHGIRPPQLSEVAWSKQLAYDSDLVLSVCKEGDIMTVEAKKSRRCDVFAFKVEWNFDIGSATINDW